MKNKGLIITLAVIGIAALIVGVVAVGIFWGRGWFGGGCCQGFGHWNNSSRFGRGMMWGGGNSDFLPEVSTGSQPLSIEEVERTVNDYINDYDSAEALHIQEIMIFDNHAYVMVVEEETGIGAFEVLVDPDSMKVLPEMGPNMMWNLKYSQMRGGMMGSAYNSNSVDMPISGEEAIDIGNQYLSKNNSDLAAEGHPDPFYGYYTIHTVKNGEVVGMLSVNGYDGEVFLHTWHGEFLEMTEHDDENNSDEM